ncbi:uncharacterized protein [Diadema setosum]|uniref:uncharacterized protein n=1 Tax=Diadema setosum TaxID=31175 RepID=UPI003B3A7D3B
MTSQGDGHGHGHGDGEYSDRKRRQRYRQYLTDARAKVPRQTLHNWRKETTDADEHDEDEINMSLAEENVSDEEEPNQTDDSVSSTNDGTISQHSEINPDEGDASGDGGDSPQIDHWEDPEGDPDADDLEGDSDAGLEGDSDADPEGDPDADPEGDPDADPEGDPDAGLEGDSDADPEGDPDADPEGDPDAGLEGDSDADPEGDSDADPEGDSDADPEGDSDADPEGDSDADPEGDSDADPELEDITPDQALLMILTFVLRHKLTGEALQDLLTLLNHLLPGLSPATKYLFRKCFHGAKDQIEIHHYCKACMTYIGTNADANSCPNDACAEEFNASESVKNGSFLLYIPLQSQLLDLFSNRDIARSRIMKRTERKDTLDDIFDGAAMQRLLAEGKVGPDDFTLLWNCDGVPVFKSSGYSIWPIQVVVNELPPDVRHKHVLFCGLWFGPKKPDMNTLLTPLISEAEQLAQGFDWVDPNSNNVVHSRAFFLVAACDSVARPALRNCKQFNGQFGCDWCLHPGEVVEKGRGTVRCYPYIDPEPQARTQNQWEGDVPNASPENPIRGVKGPSLLLFLPLFNIITGFVADYMHCALLGVTRQFVRLWHDSAYHDRQWYLGNKTQDFDNKLLSTKPPRELRRAPRSILTKTYWKATEWKSFLLYYSPFVLGGLLPLKYLKHWCLLVFAIHILLQAKVSRGTLDSAELALKKFVIGVESLYGKEHISFNIHLLTHLADNVRNWGPLWAASAFSFEANNGKLLQYFHGTQYVPQQISGCFLLWRSIPRYLHSLTGSPPSGGDAGYGISRGSGLGVESVRREGISPCQLTKGANSLAGRP